MKKYFYFFIITVFFNLYLYSQNNKQQQLKEQKLKLQQEIKKINTLLLNNKSETENILQKIENINIKIKAQSELIDIANQELELLVSTIEDNQNKIKTITNELRVLKKEYAEMLLRSYKNRSKQNKLMFLLSSSNFTQLYKRSQYLQQYISYRKNQGEEIIEKKTEMEQIGERLLSQKKEQEKITLANIFLQKELQDEKAEQNRLVTVFKNKESEYTLQIKIKEQESKAIDNQIERLIKEAIAASSNNAKSLTFKLTPEAKKMAYQFIKNKGNLPWPVEKGVVVRKFGRQKHPVVPTTIIQSNGIGIATPQNAKVRSVFKGRVLSVLSFKGSNPTVLIKHGNFVTAYKNLEKVYVKKGQRVNSNENIGEVFTNPQTKESVLFFSIFSNMNPEDPLSWILKI